MGYMGFGMKKSVYTRRPKKVFAKLKSVYGEELKKRANDSFSPSSALTLEEKEKIKLKITKDIRYGKQKTIKVILVSLVLLITVPIVITYLYTKYNQLYYSNWQRKMSLETLKKGSTIEHHFNEDGSMKKDVYLNSEGQVSGVKYFPKSTDYKDLQPNK